MIKYLLLLLSFLLFSSAEDLSAKSPMLWEITGNTLQKPSYLFGTFHSRDPEINILHPSVTFALGRSEELYTEITMTHKSSQEVFAFSRLPKPLLLKARLETRTLRSLSNYLDTSNSGLSLEQLSLFKTWSIAFDGWE